MKKNYLAWVLALVSAIYTLSASAQETAPTTVTANSDNAKTVAWYVANIKEARAKNKACFGASGSAELQATPDCVNSLQALKMSFAVAD